MAVCRPRSNIRGGKPRAELVAHAIRVPIEYPGEDFGQAGERIESFSLEVSMKNAIIGQCSAPKSEPPNNIFLRSRAIGRRR